MPSSGNLVLYGLFKVRSNYFDFKNKNLYIFRVWQKTSPELLSRGKSDPVYKCKTCQQTTGHNASTCPITHKDKRSFLVKVNKVEYFIS